MKAALKDPLFWSHETTLKSRRESARGARTFVSQHLLEHHQPALVDNVRSVVSELAGMLIAHDGQESFTISLKGGGGEVLLLMQDGFAGTVERLMGTAKPDPADPQFRITDRLSERWGVSMTRPAGAVVWASFTSTDSPEERVHPTMRPPRPRLGDEGHPGPSVSTDQDADSRHEEGGQA
jgi:hypothetical protein